jgi:hypothetical protein
MITTAGAELNLDLPAGASNCFRTPICPRRIISFLALYRSAEWK